MKIRSIISTVLALAFLQSAFAQAEFTPDSIKSVCKRVASGRLTTKLANGWQVGTYFEGVMALYDLTKDKKYLDSTVGWAAYHNWAGANGEVLPTNYDNSCCYQAYLETYLADPTPARLANVQNALNYVKNFTYTVCPNRCGDVAWPIVDMYHMSAPSYPRAAKILNDPIIYDSIARFAVMNAKHHYNTKVHLFNSNCSDTTKTRDWWGRGCGWGVCATCRVHQYLPANHPGRAWFEQKIRETSAKLLTLQNQTDGMWRSELFTPTMQKEASGTGFFCYQLFYGIRNRILDTATYLGPAKKAWKGLVGCVGVDPARPNLPGYSQGVGGGPSDNFGITNHDEYTEGAFLMAGNEFYKYLTDGQVQSHLGVSLTSTSGSAHPSTVMHCAIDANQRIAIPSGAIGAEFYTPAGRKIGAQMFRAARPDHIVVPEAMTGKGVVIVRFKYK
jgi:unsaturated rhamnogalacturonyl hydrolase